MAAGGDGMGGPDDFATAQSQMLQKAVFGPLLTLYKERWEDSKRFLTGRVLLEHLQLLLVLLQPQFLWTFDTSHWCGCLCVSAVLPAPQLLVVDTNVTLMRCCCRLWQIANYSLVKILTVPAVSGSVGSSCRHAQTGRCAGSRNTIRHRPAIAHRAGARQLRVGAVRHAGVHGRHSGRVRVGVARVHQEGRGAKQVVSSRGGHLGCGACIYGWS
jgi:hypothetical protein